MRLSRDLTSWLRRPLREEQWGQLMQCLTIDPTLEEDDFIYRLPVVHPAPPVEFRPWHTIEIYTLLSGDEPQHEPYLLLPDADRVASPAYEVAGKSIAQPALRMTKHLYVLRHETGLLLHFPVHRLQWLLVAVDSTLRELPSILTRPFGPEQLPVPIAQDNPDIRSISITINHLK